MKTAQKNLGCIGIEYRSEDRPAIIDLWNPDAPRQLSYPEFHDACDAMARGFINRGFVKGDRIGILCVNRLEFLVVFFGAMRSEEHTSELQSRENLVCRLLLEKKKRNKDQYM